MKKLSLMVIACLVVAFSQAQDITDAVRYSSDELSGTARFRALSGAFGALGGDISSLSVNPAGSAVFLNSFATLTLSQNESENNTRYFNGMTSSKFSDVNFDQAGAVLVFNSSDPDNNWGRFTLAFNYEEANNFENRFTAKGVSSTSIDEYFLGYADGIPLELLETMDNETISDLYLYLGENEGYGAQQAFLGYQGFVINPVTEDPDNTAYSSAIAPGNFDQEYAYAATGLNGKFTFNLASEYNDFLYLGANVNTHFINYDRSTRFMETNNNPGSETNEVLFSNNLSTTGSGFSFQVGTITKIGQFLRLGAAYESPTWFTITEQATQRLETYSEEFDESVVVNPNIINLYPDYKLRTPAKVTGSAAILLGTVGLVSFDYSYKDYTTTEFRPLNDPEFIFQNNEILENLRAANTYRIGGELRLEDLSLRGGYRIEESPYKNETTIGELSGYTLGLGYNFGALKVDLAYENASRIDNPQLYNVGLTNTAAVERDFTSFILSLSFGI